MLDGERAYLQPNSLAQVRLHNTSQFFIELSPAVEASRRAAVPSPVADFTAENYTNART